MKAWSYYVETSVWGMIPKGQPREMRRTSLQFLRRFPRELFHISTVVYREIAASDESSKFQIMEVLNELIPISFDVTSEVDFLARFYIESGILPPKKLDDALHVALATVHEMRVLVSWNHRHIANARKTELYRAANLIRGYSSTPMILTPVEVIHG